MKEKKSKKLLKEAKKLVNKIKKHGKDGEKLLNEIKKLLGPAKSPSHSKKAKKPALKTKPKNQNPETSKTETRTDETQQEAANSNPV